MTGSVALRRNPVRIADPGGEIRIPPVPLPVGRRHLTTALRRRFSLMRRDVRDASGVRVTMKGNPGPAMSTDVDERVMPADRADKKRGRTSPDIRPPATSVRTWPALFHPGQRFRALPR